MSKVIKGECKNGLAYYILPQKNFGEKMAAVVVKRGANYLFWKNEKGEKMTFPQGTAHFIEHKLFQQTWGDAFAKLTEQGACANAFTDGEKTVYYFSCRERFLENLKILLDFVQNPYFTEEDTEKEKDIIASEITMYEDDPNWVSYYQLLEGMYEKHPIRHRIAGTVETIQEVTKECLQKAYDVFYTTDEMALVCTGDVIGKEILRQAERMKQKKTEWEPVFSKEPDGICEKYKETRLQLQVPYFQIGFKLSAAEKGKGQRQRILMGFLSEVLAGESSAFFQKAYEKEWLDDPLGGAYFCGEEYAFLAFSGEGEYPEETAERLGRAVEKLKQKGISSVEFQRIRKKMIGRFLRRLDSVQGLCLGQIEWAMEGVSVDEVLQMLKTVQKEEVEKLLQNALSMDTMVLSVIR